MELRNARVLLTGATGGIGSAIAAALAAGGARLTLVGRNTEALERLAMRLSGEYATACDSVAADLCSAAGREAVRAHCARHTELQVLVNNAGISAFGLLDAQPDALIDSIVQTNLVAPMQLTRALLPLLQQAREAVVLNVGSTFGSIGYPGFTSYCASKFGLRGFSEALRREIADGTVRVHYLAPRATRTALNSAAVNALNAELGNATDEPEVVARAVVKLIVTGGRPVTHLGFPEKLFARINQLSSTPVDAALRKQLATIKRIAAGGGA